PGPAPDAVPLRRRRPSPAPARHRDPTAMAGARFLFRSTTTVPARRDAPPPRAAGRSCPGTGLPTRSFWHREEFAGRLQVFPQKPRPAAALGKLSSRKQYLTARSQDGTAVA